MIRVPHPNYRVLHFSRVHICSPSSEEIELVKRVWGITPTTSERSEWDLSDRDSSFRLEPGTLVMACNTFMCAEQPAEWLSNLERVGAKWLLVQDLVRAKRTPDRELSLETGDVMRYSLTQHGIYGATDPGHVVFDFSTCGRRVLDYQEYKPPYHLQSSENWQKLVVLLELNSAT